MFIAAAFIKFKKNKDIKKPFVIFKNDKVAIVFTVLVTATVGFANFFTIIQPAIDGDIATTVWSILGPLLFTAGALTRSYTAGMKKRWQQGRILMILQYRTSRK